MMTFRIGCHRRFNSNVFAVSVRTENGDHDWLRNTDDRWRRRKWRRRVHDELNDSEKLSSQNAENHKCCISLFSEFSTWRPPREKLIFNKLTSSTTYFNFMEFRFALCELSQHQDYKQFHRFSYLDNDSWHGATCPFDISAIIWVTKNGLANFLLNYP